MRSNDSILTDSKTENSWIALIQTAFLGDLLLGIPLMINVRRLWPDKQVVLVCRHGLGDFFKSLNLVDEVVEVQKGNKKSYREAVLTLQKFSIGLVFSPHQSLRSAWLCSLISASEKVGFYRWWNGIFFSKRIRYSKKLPDALRQLSLLMPFDPDLEKKITQYAQQADLYLTNLDGLLPEPPSWASMTLNSCDNKNGDSGASEAILQDAYYKLLTRLGISAETFSRAVFIFPGSVWATKRWTENGYQELGRSLSDQGYSIFVMGGPGEEELCSRVAREIPAAWNLAGLTSLFESFLLIRKGRLVIGNDSASGHLASCTNTPIIAIFGPTVLSFGFRPWGQRVFIIEEKKLACRPCGKHGHTKCPIKTHECMKHISVSRVIDVAMKALALH